MMTTVKLLPKAVVMTNEPSAAVTAVPSVWPAASCTATVAFAIACWFESTTTPVSCVVLAVSTAGRYSSSQRQPRRSVRLPGSRSPRRPDRRCLAESRERVAPVGERDRRVLSLRIALGHERHRRRSDRIAAGIGNETTHRVAGQKAGEVALRIVAIRIVQSTGVLNDERRVLHHRGAASTIGIGCLAARPGHAQQVLAGRVVGIGDLP